MLSAIRVECYGATRTQQGQTQNEDAFLVGRGELPFAALSDGAGNAERAAKKVLKQFEKMLGEAAPEQVGATDTWTKWVKLLDSSLLGGAQSTFLAVALLGSDVVGACVGDSRAYLINREGHCRILTERAAKHRLGSGKAQSFPIHLSIGPGDILLLLSDGAWTPLNQHVLQRTVMAAAIKHFSEVPTAILDAAGRIGTADDMTAVALKLSC